MMSCSVMMRPTSSSPATQWSLGGLTILHGSHGRCLPPRQGAELLIPTRQPLTLYEDNLQRILRPPLDSVYLSADGQPWHTSAFVGWRLSLDPDHLCQLAAELSDHRLSPARFQRRLREGHFLQPRTSPQRELFEALLQLLQLSSSSPLLSSDHLELVGLDRSIQRLVVLLLCGDQIQAARQCGELPRGSKSQIMDELLVWIEANLQHAIQLPDLARQSGYSQRSLRNFFQERFGCGPVQWIRVRRLERAREHLLSPEPGDSVSQIAASVGYPHLSQFSRDFQRQYRIRPSELLREGLRAASR